MAGDGILSVSRFVGFCHLLVHIYMSFYWLINTGPRLCAGCVSFCCFCHVIVHIFMAFYSLIDDGLKLADCVCIFLSCTSTHLYGFSLAYRECPKLHINRLSFC